MPIKIPNNLPAKETLRQENIFCIPEEMLKKAAQMAVCKINVGTDLRVAYVGAFRKALHFVTSYRKNTMS